MTWWMRPGPRRFCARRNASPSPPSVFATGTRTPVKRTSQWVFQPRPACPITGTGRTTSTPSVSAGTRIIVPRRCGSASGSEIAKTTAKPAPSAPLENHLCPSITQSSPSRTARVCSSVGSEPATSGSVIAKNDRISPATSGRRKRSFCSSVPNRCRISAFPASGAWHPNTSCAYAERPISSLRQA